MSRPANRITVSTNRRGTTVKASGLAARALFEALTGEKLPASKAGAQAAPLLPPGPGPCTVHFEDLGQDFLRWHLDAQGQVMSENQSWLWAGCRVVNVPEVGKKLQFTRDGSSDVQTLRYVVTRVVRTAVAVQSGGTGC